MEQIKNDFPSRVLANNQEELFNIIDEKDLNIYKEVHLFFYSYNGEELHLLLFKSKQIDMPMVHKVSTFSEESKYTDFHTQISEIDNLPTFAISRLMATTFRGVFTDQNIYKLSKNEELTVSDISSSSEYHWTSIWENDKFTEWLDKISSQVIQYDYIENKMVYFISSPLFNTDFANKNFSLLNLPFEVKWFNYNQVLNEVYSNENINYSSQVLMNILNFDKHIKMTNQKFILDEVDYYIIIACKKSENKKDQAGFFHFPALIPGIYRRNLEKWIYLVASCDEFPDENMLRKTKAIIIPGSDLNVYSQIEFLRNTEKFLKNVILNYPNIKFLGLCFGMQILVTSLGGKVEPMGKFIVGAEKLEIDEKFWNFEFVKKSKVKKTESLNIHQAHGDYVSCMPSEEFSHLEISKYSKSESCPCEIISSNDERIFCIQGHPEYDTEFSFSRAAVFLCKMRGLEPTKENMIKVKEETIHKEKYSLNITELRKICYSFLKSNSKTEKQW